MSRKEKIAKLRHQLDEFIGYYRMATGRLPEKIHLSQEQWRVLMDDVAGREWIGVAGDEEVVSDDGRELAYRGTRLVRSD